MLEYHRNKKRVPVGVLVSLIKDGEVRFGWSLCNKKDTFSKSKGKMIAERRAEKHSIDELISHDKVPQTLRNHLAEFSLRAHNYYQDKDVPHIDYEGLGGELYVYYDQH
ncbi:MAG: hypothetical protein KDC43_29340 [Saprospiraceae bacterium]|nr:hypothetical protein [Saprospiraceae bacterium]